MNQPPSESRVTPSAEKVPADGVTAEGSAYVSTRLRYVDMAVPEPGKVVQLTPAVSWCRIPLPVDLNHINVWLVETDDGCMLVDTGLASPVGKEAWEIIEREVLAVRALRGIFITHIHPDHIGLSAWLQDRHRVPVFMSQHTYDQAQLLLNGDMGPTAEAEIFLRMHGAAESMGMQTLSPSRMLAMTSGMPAVQRLIADAEVLQWGGTAWTAIETNGHADGHLCLFDPAGGVLISGDQILPTISSNVAFTWRNRDRNPLDSFMASLRALRLLPEDTLVLPSHGVPFRGMRHRIDDLLRHHEEQLDKLVQVCAAPQTAFELLPVMYRRQLQGMHLFLGLAEALAHLEWLAHAGRVERRTDAAGVLRYAA
jgi:glyoxylase-like metal-dependent hydrolase (beta-lactamase superfamily II)